MKRSAEQILSALRPNDIFSMNPDTIEQEKEEYISQFKPEPYNVIKNFSVQQKVILLYRQALEKLNNADYSFSSGTSFSITDLGGNTSNFNIHYSYDIKIGKMYVSTNHIVFVINKEYKKYYENYIQKTKRFPKLDKEIGKKIKYMLPRVKQYFEDTNENLVIVLRKTYTIYPLREFLNYFDGKMKPEYVASILTRLYYFVCYLDINGITHNGITIDNLFFAPGKWVDENAPFNIENMRIVGIFGGWFFSTYSNEKICGVPKEVYDILPSDIKTSGFSSFNVDALSIKAVGRELLGDTFGKNLTGVPKDLLNWINTTKINANSYEEFKAWEKVVTKSFGERRFVDMDVSID